MRAAILTQGEAVEKRRQLLRDGFCVIPGVLRGSLLERLREYSDRVLDTIPPDTRYRYQGSDLHVNTERRYRAGLLAQPERQLWTPLADELIDLPEAAEACGMLGLEGKEADDTMLILSKPAHGPALYWHQDLTQWNHPSAALPWPTRIFLSYYLVDTTRENGCLKAIPGTHLRRIPLHDVLPAAHGPEIQAADESHPAFQDHPEAVDLPVQAGDLVINDARVLHAAYPNRTDRRRTLILQWHSVFPWPTLPSWWEGAIPDVLQQELPPDALDFNRIPGKHLARM